MQLDIAADPKKLCRICMAGANEHFVDLYDAAPFGQLSLQEMLRTICAPVFAKSDAEDVMPQMPTKMCLECRNATVAAYNLHLQCIEADRRLGELIALMWELQGPGGDEIGEVCESEHENTLLETQKVEMVEEADLMGETENEESLLEEVLNQQEKCNECGVSFSSFGAHRQHNQEGNCRRTRTYPCRICGKIFDKQTRMQYHMYSHRERVACTRCDQTFRNQASLLVHINRKRCSGIKSQEEQAGSAEVQEHPEEQEETKESAVADGDTSAEAIDLQCTKCGVSFTSGKAQRTHIQEGSCQQKPTFPCKLCGKVFDKLSRMQYHRYTHNERFPCPNCVQTFRYKVHLRRHLVNRSCRVMKASISQDVSEPLIEATGGTSSGAFEDPLLASEIKVEEPEIEDAETELESEIFAEQIAVPEERKMCKICSETFERMAMFRLHMRQNHQLHVCGRCYETFETEQMLEDHKKTSHIVVPAHCLKCDQSFKSQKALKRHKKDGSCLQEAEPTSKPFACDLCEKSFETAVSLGIHKNNHGNRIYCDKCGRMLKSKADLQSHIARGICMGERARTCLVCKKLFATVLEYKQHRREAHPGPIDCQDCGRKLLNFHSFYVHVKERSCENIRKRSAKRLFPKACTICGEMQASASQLKLHMKAKHLDKIFYCAPCLFHFPTKEKFDAHAEKHAKNLVNMCRTCNTSFPTMSALKRHKFTHMNPVNCTVCERTFRGNAELKVHMSIHTGEKPHVCELCPMRFRTAAGKQKHMRTHSSEPTPTEPIAAVCEQCGSQFSSPHTLKMHIRTKHEGIRRYACTFCDLKFYRTSSMKRHLLTHTNERPFKCSACPNSYKESSELVKHVASEHGDGNAYVCDRCDKSFRFVAQLRKHYAEHAQAGFDSTGTQEEVRFTSVALLNMRFAKEKQQQRAEEEGGDSE